MGPWSSTDPFTRPGKTERGHKVHSHRMRVTHIIRFDAGLYRGGGEIKAERTREALSRRGVDVQVYTPLQNEFGDIVHFFGAMSYYWTVAEYCLRRKVPYVCSPIFVTPRTPRKLKWRAFRQRYIEFKGVGNPRKLLTNAQETYYQTEIEKRNALAFFGKDIGRPVILANGIEPRFSQGAPDLFRSKFGIWKPFVLQASVFNPNKHQLELIQAMRGSDWDLVLLGRSHNEAYVEACKKAAGPNVHFLGNIPHDDPLLPAAYAAAELFCLPSSDDIFANSAMEAAVAGCRLVLGDSWGGQEIYGEWATWVRPGDAAKIKTSIASARARNHDAIRQAEHFLGAYSWDVVAERLKARYEAILSG